MKQLFTSCLNKVIPVIFTGIILSACTGHQSDKQEENIRKPNIIYIMADDLGYGDLSLTGQEKFETPNIDKLAADGIFFTQHYSGSTVCGPARSSLMTGTHSGHTFIRGNEEVYPEGQYPLEAAAITIAKLMKKEGYVTGAFGKWGLGYPGSEGDPNNQGFDEFYGYNCQRLAHSYYPYHLWHNQTRMLFKGNQSKQTNVYAPEIIHENALAFLEMNKDTSFFLYCPSIIPHAELAAPESYMEKYRAQFAPETPYKGIDDGESYKNGGYASQAEPHAAFAAMVSLLDDQVGEIRKKLEELGIVDNTLLIFTSDNGPHDEGGADPEFFNSNANFRGMKRDLYEGGIRVPLVAYWPGKIKPGSTSNHISAFWDFLPTVCEIAEISPAENVDGISYLPALLGNKQKAHDFLYWEFHEGGGKQAARMGDWKAVRLNMANNLNAPIELYNLAKDEGEQNDVAPDNPEIVKQMADIMNKEHVYSKVFEFEFEKK